MGIGLGKLNIEPIDKGLTNTLNTNEPEHPNGMLYFYGIFLE